MLYLKTILASFFIFLSFVGKSAAHYDDIRPGSITVYVSTNPDNDETCLLKLRRKGLSWCNTSSQPSIQGNILQFKKIFPQAVQNLLHFHHDEKNSCVIALAS